MDLFEFTSFLWQRKKQIVWVLIANAILIVIIVLVLPKKYTSYAKILPPSENTFGNVISRYSSIASMLGVNLNVGSSFSPLHFESIIKSRPILEKIITFKYNTKAFPGKKVDLVEYFDVKGDTPEERMEWCLELMRNEVITVEVNPENFITTVKVTTPEPELSYVIVSKLVQALQDFNRNIIQKEALDKRHFLRKRLKEVGDSLRVMENQLIQYMNNVQDITLPEVQVRLNKEKRQIDILSAIYMELRKQEELLRLQEFTQLAPLKILEPPSVPALKSFPQRAIISILYMIGVSVLLLSFYLVKFYHQKYLEHST